MIFHFYFAVTVLGAVLSLWLTRDRGLSSRRIVRISLLYLLCVQWGFGAALTAIPHILFPDQTAQFIGWPSGSPFQLELGFASLGTSLLGILCIWLRGWFWLAPVLSKSVFLLGAAYVHIADLLTHGNMSPGNAGAILFYDIAVPFIAVGLFVAYARQEGLTTSSSSEPAASG
jgi:hypothetical protein